MTIFQRSKGSVTLVIERTIGDDGWATEVSPDVSIRPVENGGDTHERRPTIGTGGKVRLIVGMRIRRTTASEPGRDMREVSMETPEAGADVEGEAEEAEAEAEGSLEDELREEGVDRMRFKDSHRDGGEHTTTTTTIWVVVFL